MENTKLMKTTRAIDILLKILSGFLKAGIILCGVFFVLLFIFGEKIVADSASLDFGRLTVTLNPVFVPGFDAQKMGIALTLVSAAIACGAALYIVGIIRGILKPMLEGSPFEAGTADKIRKLAFITLIGGFVIEVCKIIEAWLELRAFDLAVLFNDAAVTGFTVNYTSNMNFAVITVLLLLLSHIFRYGETLQRESDETL